MVPRRTTNEQGRVYELYVCGGKLSGASPDCTMPSIRRESLDEAAFGYFANVGLDVEETRRRFASQIATALAQARGTLVQAERQRGLAEERLTRVRRDYQDGKLDASDWAEQREQLQDECDAAAAEAERLRRRVEEITAEGERLDADRRCSVSFPSFAQPSRRASVTRRASERFEPRSCELWMAFRCIG